MQHGSLPHVGEDFVVAVLMHGDDDARLQPGVVEGAERAEARIVWILQAKSRQNAADPKSAASKL
jgi:hypothetical protein